MIGKLLKITKLHKINYKVHTQGNLSVSYDAVTGAINTTCLYGKLAAIIVNV